MDNSSSSQSKPSISARVGDTESIIATVVTAVTNAHGMEPATPLYETIDPDALEALYQHGSPEVSFEYIGYCVTIHSDRTVSVVDLDS